MCLEVRWVPESGALPCGTPQRQTRHPVNVRVTAPQKHYGPRKPRHIQNAPVPGAQLTALRDSRGPVGSTCCPAVSHAPRGPLGMARAGAECGSLRMSDEAGARRQGERLRRSRAMAP